MSNKQTPASSQAPQLEKLVAVDLDSGTTVYVTALSIYIRQTILENARKKFPDPDPTPYQKKVADAVEGFTVPATESKEYLLAMGQVLNERNRYMNERVVLYAVVEVPNKEDLIRRYASRIALMKEDGVLPDDPWQATLLGALVRTNSDINKIMAVANESEPLTEAEVTNSARLFRLAIPGTGPAGDRPAETASSPDRAVLPDA